MGGRPGSPRLSGGGPKASLSAAALALVAAACTPAPKPPPRIAAVSVPPPPTLVTPPPAAPDWRDLPLTSGTWRYAPTPDGSAARFGPTPAATIVEMRCDRMRREVTLTLVGQGGDGLELRTSYAVHRIQFRARMPEARATFAANDRTLDEVAFSRGRFSLAVPGGPTAVLPAWAEPARVVEDCRDQGPIRPG